MKSMKSFLLGSAAGLVAVTAGQAADLPVKAKPVEYVKVCSLYGAGFYYMPGTDMCIKIGGYVRSELVWGHDNGNITWGPFAGQANNRDTNNMVTRERGYITADAREQTAYGTARAYISTGIAVDDTGFIATSSASAAFSNNRAFLQWAGITTGLAESFFDFYTPSAVQLRSNYLPTEDTSDGGWWVFAYTAQLGSGVAATISAEQRRSMQIFEGTGTLAAPVVTLGSLVGGNFKQLGTGTASGYAGEQAPDIVANIRVDETWGGGQIMAALHEVNPLYYDGLVANSQGSGHASDTWGWVVAAGLKLNLPMITQGDWFQAEINYTQGATRYVFYNESTNWLAETGNSATYGILSDCVLGANIVNAGLATQNTGCNLTTAWTVNASFEHYWTPAVHQSIVGAYGAVTYNSQANAILCTAENGAGNVQATGGVGTLAVAAAGCNNNWSMWGTSSRLQWDVTKSFYLAVELMYQHMNSATSATGLLPSPVNAQFTALGGPANGTVGVGGSAENAWEASVRVHKDFLP